MRFASVVTYAAPLLGLLSGSLAADSTLYHDTETGFTFSQYYAEYAINKYIVYRTAVPSGVASNAPYDIVLQVVAPVDVGWAGLAWGGSMLNDPLAVSWQNGNGGLVSSRYTTQRAMPTPYSGTSYQIFRVGTHSNGTHWQFTAKCSGCSSWSGTYLSPTASHILAFAYSATKPSNPSSNQSSFVVHDVTNYWNHDFSAGQNSNFASLVTADS